MHRCQCPDCRVPESHPNKHLHHQMNLLLSRLNEPQRRWYAALESDRIGHGGDRLLSLITGLDDGTIRRGRAELAEQLEDQPLDHQRREGGGRPSSEKKTP